MIPTAPAASERASASGNRSVRPSNSPQGVSFVPQPKGRHAAVGVHRRDPEARWPSSAAPPAVTLCICDADGRLLLVRHDDGDLWSTPGGSIEPGETPAAAAVRDGVEELGVEIHPIRIIGVFGGPGFDVRYDNGGRRGIRHHGLPLPDSKRRGRARRRRPSGSIRRRLTLVALPAAETSQASTTRSMGRALQMPGSSTCVRRFG